MGLPMQAKSKQPNKNQRKPSRQKVSEKFNPQQMLPGCEKQPGRTHWTFFKPPLPDTSVWETREQMCWGGWEKALEESTCRSVVPVNPGPSQRRPATWVPSLVLLYVPHTHFFFLPQVCRPSPFQHLQSMYVRDAFQDLAFHTLQFEWTLAIHIPLCSWTGDLGSQTEGTHGGWC